MALPSNTDPRRDGQDTPTPIRAADLPIAKTQLPRVPRRWVIGPRLLAVWGGLYLVVVTVCVILWHELVTR